MEKSSAQPSPGYGDHNRFATRTWLLTDWQNMAETHHYYAFNSFLNTISWKILTDTGLEGSADIF